MTDIDFQDDAVARLADSWRACLRAASPDASALARGLIAHSTSFADAFYATLLDDPRAARFLSVDQVRGRLHPGLQDWLAQLLEAHEGNVDTLIQTNLKVGLVHARIDIPVDLVNRGTRVLREKMLARLAVSGAPREVVFGALSVINASLDLALECMTLAYADAQDDSTRADAAYRLFSLAHNIGTERERQRALLLDWENDLLFALASGNDAAMPGSLSDSEFGLWFLHKGLSIVGDTTETTLVRTLMREVDDLLASGVRRPVPVPEAVAGIRKRLGTIRKVLLSLMSRIGELEAGSDTLTQLLNRRFLPTVLRRSIDLADSHGHQFALVSMDMDHFKQVNDTWGHDVGDRVLKHVAALLSQAVRSSDYVFRLGGEEFLVVLVGTDVDQAARIALELLQRIRGRPFILNDGSELALSASVGVAGYDGHPDYERLLNRADKAMYAAKNAGRDRVEVALPGPLTDPA
ncbi:diguanylate cyclase [Luteimonas sp. A478]